MDSSLAWLPDSFGFERLIRTHVSEVLIGREEVLKAKQAVCLPFVDHRQLSQRSHSCFEELRLNRRLAHSVYKGVCFLHEAEDGRQYLGEYYQQELEPPATAIEAFVSMRRLDEGCSLAAQLQTAEAATLLPKLRVAAQMLANFHRELPPLKEQSEEQFVGAAVDNLRFYRECKETPVWPRRRLELLEELQRAGIEEQRQLLRSRAAAGLIRDGHGDLRLDHIFFEPAASEDLASGLQIIDCIEFSEKLRRQDVLNDLAFLLMELDFERRGDLAAVILEEYGDRFPEAYEAVLLPLFKSYRALVRAKVEHVQAGEDERHLVRAGRFLGLAARYLLGLSPGSLILVGGPMGVGKSSVARALAEVLDAEYLSSDELRNEMYGHGPESRTLDFGAERYSDEGKSAVYSRLRDRAEDSLSRGTPVIVDATFSQGRYRELFLESGRLPQLLMCDAEEEQIRERLRKRSQEGAGASDGREALLSEHLRAFEWPDVERFSLREPLSEEGLFALAQKIAAGHYLFR